MLREGFSTMRWRLFSGSKPPSAPARPEKIRRRKKMPGLQAAIDAWNDINTQIEEFIAENVGRR